MRFRKSVAAAAAACFLVLVSVSGARAVVIDFNALPGGHILTSADFLPGMTLSVSHNNSPPDDAIIFDSDCTIGTCTGGDDDLRTPGTGPGNTIPQFSIMIIADDVVDTTPADGLVDDPDDSAAGGTIALTFPDTCYKLVRVRAVIDFQAGETSQIEIDKLGGGTDIVPLPLLGDNSAASIDVPNPPAATEIRYVYGGSGGLDDLEFIACCGDGVVDSGEECDDGNTTDGDGCQATCVSPVCGDGIVDPGEQCDDGNTTDGDGCQGNCLDPVCGDGIVDAGEQCDDGNTTDGDGCQGDCQNPVCGDGIVDAGEQCDDGNTTDGDGCQGDCQNPVCGDGIVDAGEQCDDGNTTDGDGCQGDCQNPVCGDGIVDTGEQCDDGNTTDGDGCQGNCLDPVCGDGIVDAGEGCDDGNTTDGDGCQGNCQNPGCGDGILDAGEECDDGNNIDGDGCQGDCMDPVCGDGIVDAGEECDGGNTTGGDGCQANCLDPVCGDGILDAGESCDDGNTTDGDGCRGDCQPSECGDLILDVGEECDDGNTTGGDGCDGACMLEMSCGDGVVDPPEECEPPSGATEVCDDRIDNDNDGLIDCDDIDDCPAFCFHDGALDFGAPCSSHKDCTGQFDKTARCLGEAVCGDDCILQAACTGIENDPAKIRFSGTPDKPDLFKLHGRHAIQGSVDPTAEGWVVSLSNEFGIIYEAVLLPGDLIKKAGKDKWKFKDRTAKKTGGIRDGLQSVKLRIGTRDELPNMIFIVKAYGDFSAATVPLMATHVTTGTEGGYLQTNWLATTRGWKLFNFD